MGFFVNLRLKAGRMMLHRRMGALRRMKQDFSLDGVRKIGILWDASYENDFQHLAALKRQLSESGKSVEVIAWIPGRDVPDKLTGLSYMKFLRKPISTGLTSRFPVTQISFLKRNMTCS